MFVDPVRQYNFDVPLGWAYHPVESNLTTVVFRWWDLPEEVVTVSTAPTLVSYSASLELWHKEVEQRLLSADIKSCKRMWCGRKPAVLVETLEARDAEQDPVLWQIMIVRGTRLDSFVRQKVLELSEGPVPSKVISTICSSLEVPTDWFLPAYKEQSEVEGYLQRE